MKAKWYLLYLVSLLVVASTACTSYDYDVPDTQANRDGFERHFGFAAPDDVIDVYYYADEMGADVRYQLGFKAETETITRIVDTLELTQVDPAECPGLSLARDFSWWDSEDIQQAMVYQKTNDGQDYWHILWYSEATGYTYYLEYSL